MYANPDNILRILLHAHGNIEQAITCLSWFINILYTIIRGLSRNAMWRKMGKQLRL
jgi:hypothetical protein